MQLALIAVAAGGVLLGFLAGFFLFKVKNRWCPGCGGNLACTACRRRPSALHSRQAKTAVAR